MWVLSCDEKELLRQKTVTGTLEELRAMGIEPKGVDPSLTLEDFLNGVEPKPSKAERRRRAIAAAEAARREGG